MILLTASALTGCSPAAEPTPTPTAAFASEEEAFAAAEAVYREYVEASNSARAGDSDAKPQDLLVGEALEGYLEGQEYLRANGVALSGPTAVTEFLAETVNIATASASVIATACLDVSTARVRNEEGKDVTPPTRPDMLAQQVTLEHTHQGFLISAEAEGEVSECAAG